MASKPPEIWATLNAMRVCVRTTSLIGSENFDCRFKANVPELPESA